MVANEQGLGVAPMTWGSRSPVPGGYQASLLIADPLAPIFPASIPCPLSESEDTHSHVRVCVNRVAPLFFSKLLTQSAGLCLSQGPALRHRHPEGPLFGSCLPSSWIQKQRAVRGLNWSSDLSGEDMFTGVMQTMNPTLPVCAGHADPQHRSSRLQE